MWLESRGLILLHQRTETSSNFQKKGYYLTYQQDSQWHFVLSSHKVLLPRELSCLFTHTTILHSGKDIFWFHNRIRWKGCFSWLKGDRQHYTLSLWWGRRDGSHQPTSTRKPFAAECFLLRGRVAHCVWIIVDQYCFIIVVIIVLSFAVSLVGCSVLSAQRSLDIDIVFAALRRMRMCACFMLCSCNSSHF